MFKNLEPFFLGSKFIVKMNNVITSYFLKQKKLTPKQVMWQAIMAKFDFVMEYKSGKVK